MEQFASLIEQRVARVDSGERLAVSKKLELLIDQWASRPDLQTYWNDYGKETSLLMSAEQFAAKADIDPDQEPGRQSESPMANPELNARR